MKRDDRISRDVIDKALLGVDLVAMVGRTVKLDRNGRVFKGLCPFHKEKRASFKVENDRGRYHCFGCGADGDAVTWLQAMEGMTFAEAVKALAGGTLPAPRQPLRVVSTNAAPGPHCTHPDTLSAREIWRSAAPSPGTIVEVYLHDRGITVQPPPSLRFVPRFNFRNGIIFPAMIAAIQSPNGDIIALQATALRADGRGKADLPKDKQRHTLGPLGAGAVRLAAAGLALGIAEGVEDALAAQQLTETPCRACLGSGRMHSVCIPTHVRALHIFADDDKAGHEAADRTSKAQRHRTVFVRLPPEGFKDWGAVAQEGAAA